MNDDKQGRGLPSVEIDRYDGPRDVLTPLFALAEDSMEQLASYLDAGIVLVARAEQSIIGHIQLVEAADGTKLEIKNMAVSEADQGRGIGMALIHAALRHGRSHNYDRVIVATATADIGNLRFYQRGGFRLVRIEPDAFTIDTGYPTPIVIDGIELRDRVWLEQEVRPSP